MKSKVFVIAGNAAEATDYAKRKLTELFHYCEREGQPFNGSMSDYVVVHDTNSLRGYSEVHGVFVGSFRERRDIREIVREIRAINNIPSNVQLIPDMWVGRGMIKDAVQPYSKNLLVYLNGVATRSFTAIKTGDSVIVEMDAAPANGVTLTVTTLFGTTMAFMCNGFNVTFTFSEHVAAPVVPVMALP